MLLLGPQIATLYNTITAPTLRKCYKLLIKHICSKLITKILIKPLNLEALLGLQ